MRTIAGRIYGKQYLMLKEIVSAIARGETERARKLVATRQEDLQTLRNPAEILQAELFLGTLDGKLRNDGDIANLYLAPDEDWQIRLFNLMAEKFPVVRLAQDYANALFLEKAAGAFRLAVLDIGMGTGRQMENLLVQLAKSADPPREVCVLGIEPSAESLEAARKRFADPGCYGGMRVEFYGIQKTAESLEDSDWQTLRKHIGAPETRLMINASFALHHTPPFEFRNELFRRLKALRPARVVLIEPYADFTARSLLTRFRNAWHHYGLTFRAIDAIEATEEEKSTVKRVFFGREFPDVLGDGQRIEQYETAEMWTTKLKDAGFRVLRPHRRLAASLRNAHGAGPMDIREADGYLGFTVHGHPIVGVIGAG